MRILRLRLANKKKELKAELDRHKLMLVGLEDKVKGQESRETSLDDLQMTLQLEQGNSRILAKVC